MGAETNIEWTDHTFNPWWGCVKVSPGCANCYAATFDARTHGTSKHVTAKGETREPHWGKDAPRRFFGDKHWREPLKWNRDAERDGVRRRVFCASMADVFEDRPDLVEPRDRLFALIHATKSLDWLLLTKRPERVMEIVPESWCDGFPGNVWFGTTAENQDEADRRIPHLLSVPAAVRFLSVEPLLGPVNLHRLSDQNGLASPGIDGIDWVIVGGESGPGARPCDVAWIRSVRDQCREAGVACFVKQLGARPHSAGMGSGWADDFFHGRNRHWRWDDVDGEHAGLHVYEQRDPKGGEPSEWPSDLRVREFPKGGA